ncbi:nucleoside-diphosphate kinase [Streptomyces althioticus]|uniref:nucleoside-diphosphate kinase n=1 Tax=Streptomyces althioticus TaxID=83380 RepID=UPI0033E0E4A2
MNTSYDAIREAAGTLDDYPWSLAETAALGDAGLRTSADHLGFMIITPDAVHRGRHLEVLDTLRRAGFQLLAHRSLKLRDDHIEELYKYGLRKKIMDNRRTHWFLTRKGLGFGVSVGLLLRHPEPGACERLLALKGASDPSAAAADSIRGAVRSYSKILALVHSSDDAPAVMRECLLFFTRREMEIAVGLKEPQGHAGNHWEAVAETLSPTDASADPVEVFWAVKLRTARVLLSHPLAPKGLAPLARLHLDLLRSGRETAAGNRGGWLTRMPDTEKMLARELDLLDSRPFAEAVARAMGDGRPGYDLAPLAWCALALAVRQLADAPGFTDLPTDRLLDSLHQAGVHLTPWESLVLENLLHFWPR